MLFNCSLALAYRNNACHYIAWKERLLGRRQILRITMMAQTQFNLTHRCHRGIIVNLDLLWSVFTHQDEASLNSGLKLSAAAHLYWMLLLLKSSNIGRWHLEARLDKTDIDMFRIFDLICKYEVLGNCISFHEILKKSLLYRELMKQSGLLWNWD